MRNAASSVSLDDPARFDEIRDILIRKGFLRRLYLETYAKFADCIRRCPPGGIALELGSGAGFVKEVIPEMATSDILPYRGLDGVIDATAMPFANQSVRSICMYNTFHHIPDVEAFLREAQRCLKPGGRVFIVDQHVGGPSSWIYRYLHHEPFHPESPTWKFETSGPLSGANGALAWIVFQRDIEKFKALFPLLRVEKYSPHTPLRFWLAGGLKQWSLVPKWTFAAITYLDNLLVRIHRDFASFVDIEFVKQARKQ